MTTMSPELQRYSAALTDLVETAHRTARARQHERVSYRIALEQDLPDATAPAYEPPAEVEGLADAYLSAAEEFEATLAVERPDERTAALMSGHWVAAAALLAVDSDAGERPSPPALATLALTAAGRDILGAVSDDSDFAVITSAYLLEHELPDILNGVAGNRMIAGAATPTLTVLPPLRGSVDHIAHGLVEAVSGLVVSPAIGLLGHSVGGFLSGTQLHKWVEAAASSVGWLKARIVHILGRAAALARRFFGDTYDALEEWIKKHVVDALKNVELGAARWVLQADDVELGAMTALQALPAEESQARLTRLAAVEGSFDGWIKWGKTGATWLGRVPAAWYANPAVAVVVAVAALGLLAFDVWTAGDHLDSPAWGPFDHVAGVMEKLATP